MSREERRRQARRRARGRARTPGRAVRARLRNWGFVGGIVVAIVAAVALIIFSESLRGDDNNDGSSLPPLPPHTAETNGRVLGDPNAPLTIIEYSDFQCPFCRRLAANVVPRIEEDYILTGKVKFEYRHMAFLGEESVRAAEASECAAEQDAFWEYHNKLFDNQKGENKGAFKDDNLRRFAEEIGLDMAAFNACFDSGRYAADVAASLEEARRRGVNSTPTVFIGSTRIQGVQYEPYRDLIEAELAKLGEATPTPSPEPDETG